MPKALKYVVIAIGSLAGVFLLALLLIALTVDPNRFKPEIVQLVQDEKQRTLTIEGDIRLKLFPKLGVDLGRTVLSERGGAGEFAALESARLYVAWWPLLRRELVVDTVVLEGVRAKLVRNPDGSTNFDDLLRKEEESPQIKFDVEGVRLIRSAVDFHDHLGKRRYAIRDLDLSTGRIRDDTPTDVRAGFKLALDQPQATVDVALKSGLVFALEEKRYALDDLDLKVSGAAAGLSRMELSAQGGIELRLASKAFALDKLKLRLKGQRGADTLEVGLDAPRLLLASDRLEGAKIDLRGTLVQPGGEVGAVLSLSDLSGNARQFEAGRLTLDLDGKQGDRDFKARLGSPLAGSLETKRLVLAQLRTDAAVRDPSLSKGGVKLEATGSAEAEFGLGRAQVQLQGQLDESRFQAKLGLARFDPLQFNFDVAIDELDVDRYLPPKQTDAKAAPPRPIDLSALKSIHGTGTIRIGSLKVVKVRASNVRFELKAGGGRVEVNPLAANLYQGSLRGAASATTTAAPRIVLKQHLTSVSVGPLLRDLTEQDFIEGRGEVMLDVSSAGATFPVLKRALNGVASVRLADGAIKGIDIAATLRQAQAQLATLRGEQMQAPDARRQTDFSELTASFVIRDGVARNDDLAAKSPLLRLAGSGQIDLANDRLDYLLRASVVGTLEGQGGRELAQLRGVTVPVRVSGPFASLSYRLDLQGLMTESAKARVQQKVEEQLKKKGGEDLLRGLFRR